MKKALILLLLLLCGCSINKEDKPESLLDLYTFNDIVSKNTMSYVLRNNYVYYESQLYDKDGNNTESNYIEFYKHNDELAVNRECKYGGYDYAYQTSCIQDTPDSYATYTVMGEDLSVFFLDQNSYDGSIYYNWYLSETIKFYTDQEITQRKYDENNKLIFTIEDKKIQDETDTDEKTRISEYTINPETGIIEKIVTRNYTDGEYVSTSETTISIESRTIMSPIAYARIAEADDSCKVIFQETEDKIIEYDIRKNTEALILFNGYSVHDNIERKGEDLFYTILDQDENIFYMKKLPD